MWFSLIACLNHIVANVRVYNIADNELDKMRLTVTRIAATSSSSTDATPLPPPPTTILKWRLADSNTATMRKRRLEAETKQDDAVPTGDRNGYHWEFVFQVMCLRRATIVSLRSV